MQINSKVVTVKIEIKKQNKAKFSQYYLKTSQKQLVSEICNEILQKKPINIFSKNLITVY